MTVFSIPPCETCCVPPEVLCCAAGTMPRTLNADLTSSCGAFNGNLEMTYDDADEQWEGSYDTTICGSECTVNFVFFCFPIDVDPIAYGWRFGFATGEGCADGVCLPTGQRSGSSGDNCDEPFDRTFLGGNLWVPPECPCCPATPITVRVYE